jgi:hypothetical protein
MTAIRKRVEDGCIVNLAPLRIGQEGGYLALIKPYAGDTSPGRFDEDFQRVTQGKLPCVLVATGDGEYEATTMGRISDLVFEVEIICASSNLRGQEARTRGDGTSKDPGLYRIMEDARERLFNRPLPSEIIGACTMRPVRERKLLMSPDRTAWAIVFECRTDAVHRPISDEDGDYTSLFSALNFPEADPGAPANPVIEQEHPLS